MFQSARGMAPTHHDVVRQVIHVMLKATIINLAITAWSSTLLITVEKDEMRQLCVSYHMLRVQMKAD